MRRSEHTDPTRTAVDGVTSSGEERRCDVATRDAGEVHANVSVRCEPFGLLLAAFSKVTDS
jgi:hypothetical protein